MTLLSLLINPVGLMMGLNVASGIRSNMVFYYGVVWLDNEVFHSFVQQGLLRFWHVLWVTLNKHHEQTYHNISHHHIESPQILKSNMKH